MKKLAWENIPFQSVSGSLTTDKLKTLLPFNIGAITRHGSAHMNIGINNQDAVQLIIEDSFMIGVLCDGMTNNHPSIVNSYSMNSTGAILLSQMIANLCAENIAPRKNKMNRLKFLRWLSEQTISRMKQIERILRVPNEYLVEFRHNIMTSTIVGFVVREKEFFTFHCGDGFISVNEQSFSLESDYSSQYVDSSNSAMFNEVCYGLTKNLRSVALFSDGFKPEIIETSSIKKMYSQKINQTGYVDLIPEFHLEVLESLNKDLIRFWPKDDASMILIRKSIQDA